VGVIAAVGVAVVDKEGVEVSVVVCVHEGVEVKDALWDGVTEGVVV